MSTKFLILIVLCCGKLNLAQLSLHTDANANSFLLKTPNLQQSVTRYYGGGQTASLQQAHQQQQIDQQQQQPQSPIERETQQRTQQLIERLRTTLPVNAVQNMGPQTQYWFYNALSFTAMIFDVHSRAQDFMENVGLGAMNIAGNMVDIMSNGGAVRREDDLELPFAKVHSKSEMGIGQALRSPALDSSEEYSRRKRSDLTFDEISRQISHIHRDKRSACHPMIGGGSDGGTDFTDVAERRRRKVNNSRSKKISRKAKKKNFIHNGAEDVIDGTNVEGEARRRKRQTENEDLNANTKQAEKDISERANQFAEKVKNAWNNFVDKASEMYTPVGSGAIQYQEAPSATHASYTFAPPVQQPLQPTNYATTSGTYQALHYSNPPQPPSPPQYSQSLHQLRGVPNQTQSPQQSSQPPSLATYADQLNAAYYVYQQQQELYNQQQQQLLRQLYRSHPDPTSASASNQPINSNNYYSPEQYASYISPHHYPTQSPYKSSVNGMSGAPTAVAPRNGLLGTDYSPSDKVSHVKFNSGKLSYNF
uniref:Uncharacterized protein n=1 Tax=Glossina austeni TaxID=7395 RepID=A0A1A9VD71_GLOAU